MIMVLGNDGKLFFFTGNQSIGIVEYNVFFLYGESIMEYKVVCIVGEAHMLGFMLYAKCKSSGGGRLSSL